MPPRRGEVIPLATLQGPPVQSSKVISLVWRSIVTLVNKLSKSTNKPSWKARLRRLVQNRSVISRLQEAAKIWDEHAAARLSWTQPTKKSNGFQGVSNYRTGWWELPEYGGFRVHIS
ncbi:unnamed protein product, partial [Polarella glacialis]